MNRLFLLLIIASGLFSCEKSQPAINTFSDPIMVKIADLQDRRAGDSLYVFFRHENQRYRKASVLAFASIQDSSASKHLADVLLSDEDVSVRKAAAFALGQTPGQQPARNLMEALTKEQDVAVLNEILEAYGKVARPWQAPTGLRASESTLDQGLSWSLYRAGLNGAVDSTQNSTGATLLASGKSEPVRLGAAHFFARGAKNFTPVVNAIADAALQDPSVDVQMASVLALRKIKTDSAFLTIEKLLSGKVNYRVRVNAIRALQAFPFDKTKNYLLAALTDLNTSVGIAASEVILASVTENSWIELANRASEIRDWRIQANLYEAVLKVNDNSGIVTEARNLYRSSRNPYQKAALLTALQQSFASLDFIEQELLIADTPVVRSAAAAAIVELNRDRQFKPALQKRFADIYTKAISSGDPAVIGTIAGALGDSVLGYRNVINDASFLYAAKKKLSLPKDNEALQPLEAAIAYFENRKYRPSVKNDFNHPIDWEFVKTIPADQRVVVKTSKGDITLRLFVEEAPGSVANFMKLARDGYFDKKFFHRVVPNFVIQAGCNRGDGWGSEDYSIRSEFSERRYKTGSVGMASAGKDTEGTQWFIAHSPTPHLDGRYTLFAEVESGLEVVHLIQVGDQIVKVEIREPKR